MSKHIVLIRADNKVTSTKDVDFLSNACAKGNEVTLVKLDSPTALRVAEVAYDSTWDLMLFSVLGESGQVSLYIKPEDLVLAGWA